MLEHEHPTTGDNHIRGLTGGDLLRSSPFQAAISGLAVFFFCVAAVVLGALFWGILDIFAEMFRG